MIPIDDWKNTDINVDSLWIIDKRDSSGKHTNEYHGNFIPQIPNQLIRRYTNEGDLVLEMFTGSGTTLFECETLNRNYVGFDINTQMIQNVCAKMANTPIKYCINNCDVTNEQMFNQCLQASLNQFGKSQADFLIAHPPYLDIVKFTDNPCDLSHVSDVRMFLDRILIALQTVMPYIKKGGYMAFVCGDVYKNSEVVPLASYLMFTIRKHFNVKMKGVIVKNIEGNRGKLGSQDIWKYRAIKSDYYLFKHEYIYVFKKEF